jgi:NADH-quinone oxidoreductase subunit G
MRRLAGNDPDVNEEWISDKDRFAFGYLRTDDRLSYPRVRDEDGELRPASWPEAFAVAARGLAAAGATGVLPGGRLTAEDAFAYSTFARVALGTHDIDFRARPLSAEEADFLAAEVVLRGPGNGGPTYADLDAADSVLLVGLEPEDEAGTLFLRLRKANRKHRTRVWSVAPFATDGLRKMGGSLVPAHPGGEADVISGLAHRQDVELGSTSVILVGERMAVSPGALTAVAHLARTTGAKLAWVPRRAGDRGAVETGCLPHLLPGGRPVSDASARVDAAAAWGIDGLPDRPGRDADAIVKAVADGSVGGLVVGGVDPDDTADPAAFRAALEAARFVVALEQRETDVTRTADVVFPVAPVTDKPGTFVNWEGRPREFEAAFVNTNALPDARVLAGIAEELGANLGFRTSAEAHQRMVEMGAWDGDRATLPETPAAATVSGPSADQVALSTWKLMLDNGSMQDGQKYLRATARTPVCRVSPTAAAALGEMVTLEGDRGSVTLPVEVADDLPDDVAWVPANSTGNGVLADLASPGSGVHLKGGGR